MLDNKQTLCKNLILESKYKNFSEYIFIDKIKDMAEEESKNINSTLDAINKNSDITEFQFIASTKPVIGRLFNILKRFVKKIIMPILLPILSKQTQINQAIFNVLSQMNKKRTETIGVEGFIYKVITHSTKCNFIIC